MSGPSTEKNSPIGGYADLVAFHAAGSRPREQWKIGSDALISAYIPWSFAMSLTQFLVPSFINQLTAVLGWLDKAEAHATTRGEDPAALLALRLAPDMWPLAAQLRIAA